MKKIKTNEELQIEINQLKSKISDLERSKLQSSTWLEHSPACTKILDLDFNLQYMSSVGISDFKMDDISEFYGEPYPLSFYPDSFKIPMSIDLKRAKETGETITLETFIHDIKGNKLWYHSTITPVRNDEGKLDNIMVVSSEITESKKTEEDLRLSEAKFRSYVEQASEGIYLLQLKEPISVDMPVEEQIKNLYEGYVVEANDSLSKMYGFDKANDLIGMTMAELHGSTDDPVNLEFLRSWIESNYRITDAESKEVDKDGNELWFTNNTIGYVEDGYLIHTWGTQINTTEKKQAEEALIKSENRFRALFEQSGDYCMILDPNTKDGIPIIVDANKAAYTMHGYTRDEFIGRPVADIDNIAGKQEVEERTKLIMTGKPFYVENIHVRKDGSTFSAAVRASRIDFKDEPSLIFTTEYDITDRKQGEEDLKHSEDKYKTQKEFLGMLINTIPNPIFYKDIQGRYIGVNAAFANFTGISAENIIGKSVFDISPKNVAEEYFEKDNELFQQHGTQHYESTVKSKDGKSNNVIFDKASFSDSFGTVKGLIGIITDITERKQAEDRIRAVEENLKNTFDLSPSIIAKANMNEGRFIQVNKAITKILGYSIDEFTSRPYMEFVHPDDRQSTIDIATEQLNGNDVTFFENRYLCKDGSYKWMAWHGTKPDDDGVVTTIGSDINERKHAELKLNQSTQLLEASQSIAKLGGWELDIATNNLFWTAETYRIHETSPEEFNPTVDAGVEYFLPESRSIISNALEAAIKEGEGYDLELETLTTKGRRIDVRTTCEVIRLDGKPTKLTGIFQDITEQKQAEEKIRTVKENLKDTFDISPSIICKADLGTGYFIEANQAVTRILGYSVEEFKSMPTMEFIHPDDRQRTIDEILEQQKGYETTSFENRYLCKNGAYRWMAWHVTKPTENGIVTAIASDINERKIIEQEIVETKQFYENIIEGVQDGIWVTDKNDVIFYANSAMEKIAGVSREQIQGNNVLKNFPEDITGEFNKFYKQAKKEKKPLWYEVKVTTAANKIIWENGWLIPQYQNKVFNGIICTVRDISERKQAEGSVRKLSTAVQQSPSTIVIADTEGNVEYVNPKFTELTGYSSSEVIGKDSNILKSGEQDAEFYKEMWKVLESKEVWRGQFHNKKKNGDLFWEASSISAILNESGDVINYIKVGEDITLQKNTETELKIALEKALESDKLKSAFLANMSHEIRTPMNGIRGFIDLLNNPDLSHSEINTYSEIINKSSDRLLSTINDIIDLSRIEAGEVLISNTTISIESVMNEIYIFHSPEAELKGLSFSLEPTLSLDLVNITTDGDKLHGILTNLVKNAIKYTEKGSVTLGCSLKNKCIEFFVEDTGVGIPKDRKQAIFNRFEQADIGNRRAFDGSGLGLAISKAYAEMLGGKIWVKSELGKGSVFYFSMPYKGETIEEDSAKNEISPSPELNPIKSLKILIVEDDEVSKELISITVKKLGKEIISATTGKEAVSACLRNPDIDLVLMDIQLPEMDGYEATREIRKFNKDLIIVAQTAYALNGDEQKALEAGCNDYISKPINEKLLWEIIAKHIGK
jgi:PAS domain S-box-containing protein